MDLFCLKWLIISAIPEGFWFYFVALSTYRFFTIDVKKGVKGNMKPMKFKKLKRER